MHSRTVDRELKFDGIRIEKGTNEISIISVKQYEAYCITFNLCNTVGQSDGRAVKGIGELKISKGSATLQIPFKNLGIIIEGTFMLLEEDITSLLSMREIVSHSMYLSSLNRTVAFHGRSQPLAMENFF